MMHAHNGFLRSGVLLTGILLGGAAAHAAPGQTIQYPSARRSGVVDDYHGTRVPDPYRWLEDPDAPETRAWIEAENRVTESYLAQIRERARPIGPPALDQVLRCVVDLRRPRVLLQSLPGGGGEGADEREPLPESLLSPPRHGAGAGRARLRASRSAGLGVRRPGDRRWPVRRHERVARHRPAEPRVLPRPAERHPSHGQGRGG